jgi:hypothetical protein
LELAVHPYSTDSNERIAVTFYSSVGSFLVVFAISFLVTSIGTNLPFWIGLPSWGTVNLALLALFNKWWWRWRIFRLIRVVSVPDLNGNWNGYVLSSYTDEKEQYPVEVNIRQTWLEICVTLRSAESQSRSVLAGILTKFPFPTLGYIFTNEPKATAPRDMHSHRGTAELMLSNDGRTLEGFYYSGRDRQRHGLIQLTRAN